MNSPSAYEHFIQKYDLKLLQGGADLQLTPSAGLKLNRRGGLQLGDNYFNALFQFVQAWRMNAPTIAILFNLAQSSVERENELTNRMDKVANENAAQMLMGEALTHNIHAIREEIDANSIGRDACAGTIMVIINTLLQGLNGDLGGKQFWDSIPPLQRGCSLGQIVEAGSNNFRHYDEWAIQWVKEKKLTDQQNKSATMIAKVLGETELRMLSTNICGRLLLTITDGAYEKLESSVLSFARVLSEKCKTSSTAQGMIEN